MFKCYECERIFDEPKIYVEHYPYGMGTASRNFPICPFCDGDYGEVEECTVCGGYFFPNELEDGKCEECIENET